MLVVCVAYARALAKRVCSNDALENASRVVALSLGDDDRKTLGVLGPRTTALNGGRVPWLCVRSRLRRIYIVMIPVHVRRAAHTCCAIMKSAHTKNTNKPFEPHQHNNYPMTTLRAQLPQTGSEHKTCGLISAIVYLQNI